MTAHRRWLQYWQTKSTPLHREESESFYRAHAEELRCLFEGKPQSVLELGPVLGVISQCALGRSRREHALHRLVDR